jgi:lipoyl(octanoyl) transferase
VAEVAAGGAPRIYLLEHPPVITLGRRGSEASLKLAARDLAARGIQVAESRRGGDVTCHFPGQVVAYPVMSVRGFPDRVRGYVRSLEGAVLDCLKAYGIRGQRREDAPGVWVGEAKIASLGVALRRFVAWHGLALNVGRDLSLFEYVHPCGLAGVRMTSMTREIRPAGDKDLDIQEVKDELSRRLERRLGIRD